MTPKTYRKKPVRIEAVQWTGGPNAASPIIDWILRGGGTARWDEAFETFSSPVDGATVPGKPERIEIDTLEGTMLALPGDWIIRGVKGEFYPCKPDIFAATYEEAPCR